MHTANDCEAAGACGSWEGGVLLPRSDVALAMVDLALDRHEKNAVWKQGMYGSGLSGFGLYERYMAAGGSVSILGAPRRRKDVKSGGGCQVM